MRAMFSRRAAATRSLANTIHVGYGGSSAADGAVSSSGAHFRNQYIMFNLYMMRFYAYMTV